MLRPPSPAVAQFVLVRSMRIRAVIFTLLLTLTLLSAFGEQSASIVTKAVHPGYPYDAVSRHISGNGLCILIVGPDGTVKDAEMGVSTGSPILDNAAVHAFRQWTFVPGRVQKVKIPISFLWGRKPQVTTLDPDISPTPPLAQESGARVPAGSVLASPRPGYPAEARRRHWTGIGWYMMIVDTATGSVTSVRVLQSSGHPMLDRVAIDAFSRWKFKPHMMSKIKTPVTWAMAHEKP